MVVAHLFILPGETMQIDSDDQKPSAGAGYYEAEPGEDYQLLIPANLKLPRLGGERCPCVLPMDKIGWNHAGAVTTIAGLRPYLETASGAKIAIVSDVRHLRIEDGKVYFRLEGRSGSYWLLTRFGQVTAAGGPWGLSEAAIFFIQYLVPLAFALLVGYCAVGAIRLHREEAHPDKSFLELMLICLLRLPLARRIKHESGVPSLRQS
jgi:hypothetical protein